MCSGFSCCLITTEPFKRIFWTLKNKVFCARTGRNYCLRRWRSEDDKCALLWVRTSCTVEI